MNKNSGQIIRIIAGVYLIYLGVKILMDVTRKQPSDMMLMAVLSVIFIVVGAFYAGAALKKMLGISFKKKEKMQDTTALDTEEVNRQFQASDTDVKKPVMAEAGPEKKTAEDGTKNESGEIKDEKASEKTEKDAEEKDSATASEVKAETKEAAKSEDESEEDPAQEKNGSKTEAEEEEVVQLEEIAEDEAPVSEEAENDFEEK